MKTNNVAHQKSTLFKAKKTVKDAKKPVLRPIVWQVDAYERLSTESRVRAQPRKIFINNPIPDHERLPSTAISGLGLELYIYKDCGRKDHTLSCRDEYECCEEEG